MSAAHVVWWVSCIASITDTPPGNNRQKGISLCKQTKWRRVSCRCVVMTGAIYVLLRYFYRPRETGFMGRFDRIWGRIARRPRLIWPLLPGLLTTKCPLPLIKKACMMSLPQTLRGRAVDEGVQKFHNFSRCRYTFPLNNTMNALSRQ